MKLFNLLIKNFFAEEQNYCFERHNHFLWYFSIEHPHLNAYNDEKNLFFAKYGFIILKNIQNVDVDYKIILNFLVQTTPQINSCNIIFGERKIYFKNKKKFIKLSKKDILIFDSERNNFKVNFDKVLKVENFLKK